MGASFVQEVAEVEQGVSRCQKLEEFLQEVRNIQFYIFTNQRSPSVLKTEFVDTNRFNRFHFTLNLFSYGE